MDQTQLEFKVTMRQPGSPYSFPSSNFAMADQRSTSSVVGSAAAAESSFATLFVVVADGGELIVVVVGLNPIQKMVHPAFTFPPAPASFLPPPHK